MEKLRYTVRVNAPAHTVWTTMLDPSSYREWTRAFLDGSYYEGSWEQGSEIRFLGPNEDGSEDGMIATVVENRPDEFVCVEYRGQIEGGLEDTSSEAARKLAGAREAYTFRESGGVTTVEVELDSQDEYAAMLDEAWPKALARLKELAEAAA
ncbi:SRPBCC family protein [Arthrobacter mobilis]|uniref:SRPBCC domain-containing protein n=1 Tax=Arthrobacter mobilis TaxID=2724944 RepID=A0A7X6HB88_9MICC|nr:SRPBCC domain-containing protein [Arthrobacter mobilis]NKX53906.1 SRPBCC domain-containing protein [Arthrobacter mobilis]